ncbi:MAG TPA: NAD(P)-dependent oxidoreductase [Ohtaekwangia sp.]|uniref:NAD(P)-dependent oxidoreductase n=1 Tax=Ohtaekwangia sp. TaxID=2066019 RepID=UPI002F932EED
MKIALIGASGFVGSHLLTEALNRGHQVTAIVRNPEKITVTHANLTVKKGDVLQAEEVANLVRGNDVVLSAYNSGWQNPNIYDDFLKGSQAIQEGVKKSGVKRLIVVGGAGSLEVAPGVQLVDTPQFPAEWKPGALAAREYLNIIRKEDTLDWTFFSPAILMHHGITDGRTGKYRLGTDQPVFNEQGESRLSAEDLSVALLDEVENKKFIRKRFTAAY